MIRLSWKKLLGLVAIAAVVAAGAAFGEDINNYWKGPAWAKGGLYIGKTAPGTARAVSSNKITGSYSGSASITPGSITAPACADQGTTITVTGAVVGDTCELGPPAAETASTFCQCYVSAANTATVRCCAFVTGTPTSGTYWATTFSHQ